MLARAVLLLESAVALVVLPIVELLKATELLNIVELLPLSVVELTVVLEMLNVAERLSGTELLAVAEPLESKLLVMLDDAVAVTVSKDDAVGELEATATELVVGTVLDNTIGELRGVVTELVIETVLDDAVVETVAEVETVEKVPGRLEDATATTEVVVDTIDELEEVTIVSVVVTRVLVVVVEALKGAPLPLPAEVIVEEVLWKLEDTATTADVVVDTNVELGNAFVVVTTVLVVVVA